MRAACGALFRRIRGYSGGCAACVSLRIFFWLRQKLRCCASRPPGDGKMLVIGPAGSPRDPYSKKNCHPYGWQFFAASEYNGTGFKLENKIATQRSGYDFERRKTFAVEMNALARSSDIQRSFLSGKQHPFRYHSPMP